LGKFKLSSHKKLSNSQITRVILIVVALLLVGSQVERFINNGTVFGYEVRTVKSQETRSRQNRSGSILGGDVSKDNQKSIACDTFPADRVSKVLKTDVERISGFVPDRAQPTLVSSCIYRTKGDVKDRRAISILLREQKDEVIAQKMIVSLKQATKGEDVKGLGDEAYFNTSANQLTVRKGKRLITVTVPRTQTSAQDSKTTAVEIAKIGL